AIYFVSAVSTLLVAIALHRALPVRDAGKSAASYLQLLQSVFALFVQVPVLRVRAAIALLMFAGFSALWTAMVLPFSAPPHSLSHGVIGLFGLAGAAGALAAARAGRWADRGFGQRTTGAGLALMLLAWWPMHRIDDALWPFVIGLVLFNLALQAVHVTNQSLIFVARPDARSRLVAGYMIFYSLGSALGAIASTALYARVGWSGVCGLGATASALALAVWLPTLWRGSASGPDETRAVTRAAA
ncbi:MAG: MFS transporter, partial [Burkholderiales bacterium]|nr:MFS transporter [Burkholderiales bacterium]